MHFNSGWRGATVLAQCTNAMIQLATVLESRNTTKMEAPAVKPKYTKNTGPRFDLPGMFGYFNFNLVSGVISQYAAKGVYSPTFLRHNLALCYRMHGT